jgi:chemotaxis protein MotB
MQKIFIMIAVGALHLSGCVTKGKYESQVSRYKTLKMEYTTLQQARESLKKELELKGADNKRLGVELGEWKEKHARVSGEAGELKDQLEATKEELEELRRARAEAEERMKSLRIMEEKFRKLIDSGDLEVVNFNGRLVIKLKANILFDPGKAKVREEGEQALKDVAAVLAGFTGRHFQVAGHTDDDPIKRSVHKDNWELSSVRAVAVVRVLAEAGVPPKMLSAAGYSEFQPVKSNDSEENKKFNRRIEITIMPEIPKM